MTIAETLAPVIDFVFPPRCPLCGDGISAQAGLCASCWGNLSIPGQPACSLCSRPFDEGIADGSICAPCLASPPRHDGIAAATIYNDASRDLVLSFKHGNRIALASMMARLMAAKLPMVDKEWLVVPVPLHRWRLWRRGFNQAALLSREISKLKHASLCVDALERTRSTQSLGGLGARERAKVLSGAIGLNEKAKNRVRGAQIVLVDDVLTSGATSNACVSALKRAGASKVVICCFARVLD